MVKNQRYLLLLILGVAAAVVVLLGLPYGKFSSTSAQPYYEPGFVFSPQSEVLCGGTVKFFKVGNILQIYSGFGVTPPDGFLVAQFDMDTGLAGTSLVDSGGASVAGWHITLGQNDGPPLQRFAQVFDDLGNLVCTVHY